MSPLTALSDASPAAALLPEGLILLSDDEVANRLTTWAGRLAAGEAQLLAYLGEFDQRQAWGGRGVLSCAHWMSFQLGMGLKAASERVRVARALRSLPLTFAAFAVGRLSFSKVRAITRMATPENEVEYVQMAGHASASQLERLARGMRRARKYGEDEAAKRAGKPVEVLPRLTVRYDDDGSLCISVRASAEDGAVLLAALEAARADLDADAAAQKRAAPEPESSAEDSTVSQATAGAGLMALAAGYLRRRGKSHPGRARRDRARLIAQVDPVTGWARLADGELLPPSVARVAGVTLAAGMSLKRLEPSDLTRFDVGRSHHDVDQVLRDLLGVVDGERCRFPSCTRKRRLHAHHVIWWSEGGRTDLGNLALVCSRHHTLIHSGGFQLALDPVTRALTVSARDGVVIASRPRPPWRPAAELDPNGLITAHTLAPEGYDRLNLQYAVSVLLQDAA